MARVNIIAMFINIPLLMILLGLILYVLNWGWKTGELKEIGRIVFFCGLLVVALSLRGTHL